MGAYAHGTWVSSTNRDTAVGVEAAPFGASDVQVIGRVTSAIYSYNVVLGPDRVIDGVTVHHLYLNPVRDPQKYLLRELDVDVEGDPVRRLLHRRLNPFFELEVVYDFAPLGAARVWGLTRMMAILHSGPHSRTTTVQFRAFEYLDRVPSDYFSVPLLPMPTRS